METRKRKSAELELTIETTTTSSPVISTIFSALPANDLTKLSMTNRLFYDIYQDELFWKQKYLTDFKQTIFNYDYKAQYIAEYLYRIAKQTLLKPLNYHRLKQFLTPYKNRDWAQYYYAVLSLQDEISDPQSILENETTIALAFKALKLGDLRAALFLINYVNNKFDDNSFTHSRLPSLVNKLSTQLLKHNHPESERLLCFTQCLLTRSADIYSSIYQKQALDMFTNLITMDETNIKDFVTFASEVFHRARFISIHQAACLSSNPLLLNCTTIMEVVTQFINDKSLPPQIRLKLTVWKQAKLCVEQAERPTHTVSLDTGKLSENYTARRP